MDTTMIAAIIAASVALGTLSITIIRESYVKRRERKRQRDNLLRYLSSLLRGAVRQASFHVSSIKTYAETLDKNPYNFEPLHMTPKPDLEAIAIKLVEEQYFNSYVDKYKNFDSAVEEIKVIFSSAIFINGLLDKLLTMSNLYYSEDNKKRKIVSEAIQEVVQTLFELQSRLGSSSVDFNKFFLFSTNAFENYNAKRTSPTNIEESYDLFIKPLVEATKGEFALVTVIAPVINPLRVAKNNYHAIEIHGRSYLQELKLMHQGLMGAVQQMIEAGSHVTKDYPIVSVRKSQPIVNS
jgi:hypothetical protein